MQIHAKTRPQDATGAEAHAWTVVGADYGAPLTELRSSVPAGWLLLHVQVDRSPAAGG